MEGKVKSQGSKVKSQKAAHMPLPWRVVEGRYGIIEISSGDAVLARLSYNAYTRKFMLSYAHRMAASLDLLLACEDELEALKMWVKRQINPDIIQGMEISIDKLERAIAKARKG